MKLGRSFCLTLVFFLSVSIVLADSESSNAADSPMDGRHLNRDNWDRVAYSYGTYVDKSVAVTALSGGAYNAVTVGNGNVYVTTTGSSRSGVSMFPAGDISSASEVHYTSPDSPGSSTAGPVYSNGLVFFTANNWLYELTWNLSQNYKTRIGAPTFAAVVSSIPAISNGYLYIGTAETDTRATPAASMVKVNPATLTVVDRYSMGNIPANAINSNPAVSTESGTEYVYFGGQNNRAYRMTTTSLNLGIGSTYTGTYRWWLSGAAVYGGYSYVGSMDGYLYKFPSTNYASYSARLKLGPVNAGQPRTVAIEIMDTYM